MGEGAIRKQNYVWIYFLAFFVLWSFRELWLAQYVDLLGDVPKAILSAIIKILIWVVPVVLLIKYKEKRDPLSYLRLRKFKEGLGWTVGVSIFFIVVIVFLNGIVLNREVSFQMGFHTLLNTVLLVGFIEEIVFRGFILRKLMDHFQFWKANLITAALFTMIHFPIWFYKGLFASPGIVETIVTIFVLGWIFGGVYKKSNTLWSVVIIHSLYNFLVVIFN